MARLSLNKAQLSREMTDLAMYRRFLPSLDLKRQQLMAERKKTEARVAEIEAGIAARVATIGAEIPMLADKDIDLAGLARLKSVRIGERNIVGQRLPALEAIEVEVVPYGYLMRPHWVDLVAERYELDPAEVAAWFDETEWDCAEPIDPNIVAATQDRLVALGLIDEPAAIEAYVGS